MPFIAPLSPFRLSLVALLLGSALLSGCDMLGIESASQIEARRLAEGRAIGSACRHAVRSIEDCYRSNPKSPKAAVFEGWREMDGYMRENNIPGMPATATAEVAPALSMGKAEELVDAGTRNGAKPVNSPKRQ